MQTRQAPARTARFKEIGRELRQALLLAEELQGLCSTNPQCEAFVEVSNEVDEVVAGLARDYAIAIRQYREQILNGLAEETRERRTFGASSSYWCAPIPTRLTKAHIPMMLAYSQQQCGRGRATNAISKVYSIRSWPSSASQNILR